MNYWSLAGRWLLAVGAVYGLHGEYVENAIAGLDGHALRGLARRRCLFEGRARIGIAVQDPGVQDASVLLRQRHRGEAVGRIVAGAGERLHVGLVLFQLRVRLAVGNAR